MPSIISSKTFFYLIIKGIARHPVLQLSRISSKQCHSSLVVKKLDWVGFERTTSAQVANFSALLFIIYLNGNLVKIENRTVQIPPSPLFFFLHARSQVPSSEVASWSYFRT